MDRDVVSPRPMPSTPTRLSVNERRALSSRPRRDVSALWQACSAALKDALDHAHTLRPTPQTPLGILPTQDTLVPIRDALMRLQAHVNAGLDALDRVQHDAEEYQFLEEHGMTREEYFSQGEHEGESSNGD